MSLEGYVAQVIREMKDGSQRRIVLIGTCTDDADGRTIVEGYVDAMNEGADVKWCLETIEPLDMVDLLFGDMPIEVSDSFCPGHNSSKVFIKMQQATDEEAEAFARLPDIDPDYGDVDNCVDCEEEGYICPMCPYWYV